MDTMSSLHKPIRVVEHIVLFKMRDGPRSQLAMNSIRGLRHLHGRIYQLRAGATLSSHPGGWTHALYGRYADKDALDAYSVHPMHLKIVADNREIVEDRLSVDWEATVDSEAIETDCGATRVVLLKCKEGIPEDQIVAVLLQPLADLPGITQHTAGPNFSLARANGFQWGFAAQFKSVGEIEQLQANNHFEHLLHSPIVESFVVVDF